MRTVTFTKKVNLFLQIANRYDDMKIYDNIRWSG